MAWLPLESNPDVSDSDYRTFCFHDFACFCSIFVRFFSSCLTFFWNCLNRTNSINHFFCIVLLQVINKVKNPCMYLVQSDQISTKSWTIFIAGKLFYTFMFLTYSTDDQSQSIDYCFWNIQITFGLVTEVFLKRHSFNFAVFFCHIHIYRVILKRMWSWKNMLNKFLIANPRIKNVLLLV